MGLIEAYWRILTQEKWSLRSYVLTVMTGVGVLTLLALPWLRSTTVFYVMILEVVLAAMFCLMSINPVMGGIKIVPKKRK